MRQWYLVISPDLMEALNKERTPVSIASQRTNKVPKGINQEASNSTMASEPAVRYMTCNVIFEE